MADNDPRRTHRCPRSLASPAMSRVMGGKPCIRGMRVTVGTVVGLVAAGRTREEILRESPYLEADDIAKALSYAAWRAKEVEVPWASVEAARRHEPVAHLGQADSHNTASRWSIGRRFARLTRKVTRIVAPLQFGKEQAIVRSPVHLPHPLRGISVHSKMGRELPQIWSST
jgi:uncharacterized protein (DUF433 family)